MTDSLYDVAIEMLERTNPYSFELEDLKYGACDFTGLVKRTLGRKTRSIRHQGALQKDFETCYEAIVSAMLTYLEGFQTNSYAYKQDTWKTFSKWLIKIEKAYEISDEVRNTEIKDRATDTEAMIAVIKALHDKSGKTVEQIADETNMGDRAVQKWIKRINDGDCRLSGQPVQVKVKTISGIGGRAPRYRTVNTMHPIILQENVLQIGTLLQSLAHNYIDNDSDVSYSIGVEIWYQLSDYGRKRIKEYFMISDDKLRDFVKDIERLKPNEEGRHFWTERDIENTLSFSKIEMLEYVDKGEGRLCNLNLKCHKEVLYNQRLSHRIVGEKVEYQAIDKNGKVTTFTYEDVENIEIVNFYN